LFRSRIGILFHMIRTVAVQGYRLLRDLLLPLGQLSVITGANGSGKSSVYRSLRLLADAALNSVVASLAREGGLPSTFWAGPETPILEIRSDEALASTIEDAFPGSRLFVDAENGRFELKLQQHGLLRPLSAAELSDGTLRYLLRAAALFTPRPPELMVLNEPETSLHPDLLPALARLILAAAKNTQMIVVSHSSTLIAELTSSPLCTHLHLLKDFGETTLDGATHFNKPKWNWPAR
jgi:predicted ATPase